MGRLLDALQAGDTVAGPANPASPRIAVYPAAEDSQISEISCGGAPENADLAATRAKLLGLAADDLRSADLVHRLPDADQRGCGGLTDEALRAYLRALESSEAKADGGAPPPYTRATFCAGCGPVWLWPTAPDKVLACPWCFRRKAGKSIPRPPVTCEGCRHFICDRLNPDAGMGRCGIEANRFHWPMQPHQCAEWRRGHE